MEKLLDCCLTDFGSGRAISDEWVASIVDDNFTGFENVSIALKPAFFDNDDVVQRDLFKKLRDRLVDFESRYDDVEVWNEMARRVPAKKLVILMWFAVERAIPKNSSQIAVQTGAAAATAFIVLCSIKGSSAFNVFNQFFYEKCFDLFRQIQRSYAFGARGIAQAQAPKPKGKGKKKIQETVNETDVNEEEALDKSVTSELLDDILRAFFILSGKFALGGYQQPATLTTNFIRDACVIDRDSRSISVAAVANLREFDGLRSKSDKAFALFHRLADDRHSNGGELIHSRIVFPRLAFWGMDNGPSSGTIPASFVLWKELMIRFLQERVHLDIPTELNTILQVLCNLYCRCTDRADYRLKVSGSVIDVLLLLPRHYQFEFIQSVDNFAKNARGALRSFSIEIIPAILRHLDLSGPDPGPVSTAHNETRKVKREPVDKTIKQEVDEDQEQREAEPEEEDGQDSEEEAAARRKNKKKTQKKPRKAREEAAPRVDALPSLYHSILRFCLDKTGSIRSRAVIHLSVLLKEAAHKDGIVAMAEQMLEADQWLYKPPRRRRNAAQNEEGEAEVEEESVNEHDDTELMPVDNLILFIIAKAAEDKAAQVRKSGVIAAASYLPAVTAEADFLQLFNLLRDRCVDASVLVRKQAAESLTGLLSEMQSHEDDLRDAWLELVLPMITDRETSVQQAASKLIADKFIQPLMSDTPQLTWELLKKVEQQDNHRRLLVRTLFFLNQEGQVKESIVGALYDKLVTHKHHGEVIWMILAELATVFKMSPKLALDTWYRFEYGDRRNKVRYVTKVLCAAVDKMQPVEKKELVDDLKHKLGDYHVAAPNISTCYLCLAKLLDAVGESAKGKHELEAFGVITLKKCQKQVKKNLEEFASELHLAQGESLESMEQRLIRVITTIGEVIQFSPSLVKHCEKLVDALKTIMASEHIQQDHVLRERVLNSAVPSINHSQLWSSRPPTALNSVGHTQPSRGNSIGHIGSQAPTSSQGMGPIIPDHLIGGQLFSSIVRSYCVLALGKFCLMDYNRAKECVPVFVHQLRVNQDHVVRNNIIIVICDLCIRNTQLVDRYSPVIAGCLKDRSTLVRHQTLESLTNLIKEQYIRWEGQIMYRFVSMILDEDEKIRKYAEFCLKNVLLKQFPDMFYRHFIECLLYFNDISKNHLTGESDDTDVDSSLKFTLSGQRNKENRMKLYKFMLNTFDDKEKFTIMSHICGKALMPVVMEEFEFKKKNVQALLRDSFDIMSSKEIKLSLDVGKGNDEEEDEPPAAILAAAKKAITEVYRLGIIQSIMPHLLDVRAFLMEHRSPLLKNCLIVLRNVCIEHKEQIEEVLGGDKQLQAEIEYDIKKFEEQQEHEQRLAKAAEEEARRRRKSQAAAAIIMSAVRNTVTRKPRVERNAKPVEPIRLALEEADGPNVTVATAAGSAEEVAAGPGEAEVKEEPMSEGEAEVAERREGDIQQEKEPEPAEETGKTQRRRSSRLHTATPTVTANDEEPNKENSLRPKSARNSKSVTEEPEKSFLPPAVPKPSKRSRQKATTPPPDANETAVPIRAISTPNKTMADLTFANLDLSAIQSDLNVTRRRRTGKRPSMAPIGED